MGICAAIAGWSRAPHELNTCVGQVYLLSFRDVTFWGGGVRKSHSLSLSSLWRCGPVSLIREHRETEYQQTFCAASNYQKVECGDPATGKPNPAIAGDLAP